MTFKEAIDKRLNDSIKNNYGIENYSVARHGAYQEENYSFSYKLKNLVSNTLGLKRNFKHNILDNYAEQLQFMYENLHQPEDKELMLDLIAYRVLGFRKVKLPFNSPENAALIEKAKSLKVENDFIETGFRNTRQHKMDMSDFGYDVQLYCSELGAVIQFVIQQYAYTLNGEAKFKVEPGDTVLDLGGCWGDTSVYFAHMAGEAGSVYSFEFIPNNIKIHQTNVQLNKHLSDRVTLIPNPVWSKSDMDIYYEDDGPASQVSFQDWPESDGVTKTICVDDFVDRYNVEKVDFIKMDIEGAEPHALEGAIKTIKKFKPKLAIAIYHSIDDFVNIPKWILDLDLGYKLNLGHYTIFAEETVIFAEVRD